MTNEELIKRGMNFSRFGALSQAFIMQAVLQQCNAVIERKEEFLEEQENNETNGKMSFVNLKSWVGVAEELKELFNKQNI